MAFRKSCLEAIGGFDQTFRVAGDDVDLCWRLQAKGWSLGFSPAAMVWHEPRRSLKGYWRQQKGYGRAEALLEAKWPEKYNSLGDLTWTGRVYTKAPGPLLAFRPSRVYHGVWGSAPFQRLYAPPVNGWAALPMTPGWYGFLFFLALLSGLGFLWRPLFLALPSLALALGLTLTQAMLAAARTFPAGGPGPRLDRLRQRALMAVLFLLHPLARFHGRLVGELTLRRRGWRSALPLPGRASIWTETWQVAAGRLEALRSLLRSGGGVVLPGGVYDRWDLEVRGGTLGAIRLLMAVEEHGQGRQLVRLRWWPRLSPRGLIVLALSLGVTALAAADQAWLAAALPGLITCWVALRGFQECATASARARRAVEEYACAATHPPRRAEETRWS